MGVEGEGKPWPSGREKAIVARLSCGTLSTDQYERAEAKGKEAHRSSDVEPMYQVRSSFSLDVMGNYTYKIRVRRCLGQKKLTVTVN